MNNVVWLSGVQQTDSVKHIHVSIFQKIGVCVCVCCMCVYVCVTDDIRGHKLVASWYMYASYSMFKTQDSIWK